MASLTHVCIWSEKGWKRVTAQEASRMFPYGTSAHSGLFMCELCGQYVSLIHGTVQVDHFRHSSSEKSKYCPERTFASANSYTYNSNEHDLPIKIRITSNSSFELLMGFIQIPNRLLSRGLKIDIADDKGKVIKTYLKERFQADGITYLSIGKMPHEKYQINASGVPQDIYNFWPKTVKGIDPKGTIFDGKTGKKLVQDSDIVVGKKYYLFVRSERYFYGINKSHVSVREICNMPVSWERWVIYEVMAKDFHKSAAEFFLEYHYRLTDTPVSFQTIWPPYIENPYIIKFNGNKVFAFLTGYAPTTHSFPQASIKKYQCEQGNVLEIESNSRQQLVSAGRTTALQYNYFWKVPLSNTTKEQEIAVEDLKGNRFESGTYKELPYEKSLKITIPFDGKIVIKAGKMIVENRNVSANISVEVNDLFWDKSIYVYIGLDCVWNAAFIQEQIVDLISESEILRKLQSFSGQLMEVPHTIGGVAGKLEQYPLIRLWVLKRIRKGYMSEQAFRYLQKLFVDY